MVGVFLLLGPFLFCLLGLALLLNAFGSTDGMASFYKGRGDWFPILQGDEKSSHRLVGAVLLVGGVVTAIAILKMGII